MINWIKKSISNWLKNGIRMGYSDGKMFDPYYQERTDPIDDIIKKEKERKNVKFRN